MHKIKKGIKKKIKGKKEKESELFTPEEYERYKKQKEEEEEERLRQEQLQQQTNHQEGSPEEEHVEEEVTQEDCQEPFYEEDHYQETNEKEAASSDNKEDWRSFLSTTDTVLKKTSVNLEHIKESSYFQVKKHEDVVEERTSKVSSPVPCPAPTACTKRWVDLDKGGIDDSLEEEEKGESKEENSLEDKEQKSKTSEPAKEIILKPIEDIPLVSEEDYADVFDTTYVDAVEEGEIQLYQIPDSPILDDLNEPDPFDTSNVEKILHIKKEEPKKPKKVKSEKDKPQKKKKKNLVSLGCAVDVLTGKAAETSVPKKKIQEVDLLADFGDENETSEKKELSEEKEEKLAESKEKVEITKEEEKCALDELLFGDNDNLPEVVVSAKPLIESTKYKEKENDIKEEENKVNLEDLAEFLDPLAASNDVNLDKKDSHLKELVSEFDVIDEVRVVPKAPVLLSALSIKDTGIDDNIQDEFDAEFAVLAAESIAKEKEKAINEIGILDEDDPFDTSSVIKVLGETENKDKENREVEEIKEDSFNINFAEEFIKESKLNKPERPAPPKSNPLSVFEEDPFDTSIAASVLPSDPFEAVEDSISLPETLKPQLGTNTRKDTNSFDPFDTSIAESFGKTELKVLEGELLSDIQKTRTSEEDLDFDFNPRQEEEKLKVKEAPARPPSPACLLSEIEEITETPVLIPQAANKNTEDFDPFDTSIAEKVHIKSLEEELLSELHSETTHSVINSYKNPPPPRPVSPSCVLSSLNKDSDAITTISFIAKKALAVDFDPFDTSIADHIESSDSQPSVEKEITSNTLNLNLKPPRPASPICLLATTPTDENPILDPILQPPTYSQGKKEEELDPFDTSIAEQFGKTELKVLETELLTNIPAKVEEDDQFDPRAQEKSHSRPPPPRPVSPACLLTNTTEQVEQNLPPLSPIAADKFPQTEEEIDPFDTSIANKFGKTEILHLETELLSDFTELKKTVTQEITGSNHPLRPPSPPNCVFATTPTDTNPPLQPFYKDQQPQEATTVEEIDPFDTSIANKFGKTELKALEETLLSESSETQKSQKPIKSDLAPVEADHLFDISPSADNLPVLQPSLGSSNKVIENSVLTPEEEDPFDTSIAAKFGQVELKVLESELLVDSGVKRNLSDDEFDPREQEQNKRLTSSDNKNSVDILDSDINCCENTAPVLKAKPVQDIVVDSEQEIDPFDTSIANNIAPGKEELKLLDKELLGTD